MIVDAKGICMEEKPKDAEKPKEAAMEEKPKEAAVDEKKPKEAAVAERQELSGEGMESLSCLCLPGRENKR